MLDCFNILIQEFQILEIRIDMRRVTKRTLLYMGCCSMKLCRILGVNIKGWVRCQMKGLPEFRINIERDSCGRVLVQRMLLAFLKILCVKVKGFKRSCLNCLTVLIF